ncbi:flavin monoamine oxidase family protein [uncultured Enterovirga sp.]|uniref:flavin monoamine oxidase family protein n=1 Tax=uncultured Enterovirga sp. TaxID=2026352 RepID=UPI0035CB5B5F
MASIRTADLLALIQNGLPPGSPTARVVVVGAGMAGLVAAQHLHDAGHEVTVIEARQRVGGRVRTLREPFTHGLYAEVGAMRIPRAHKLSMAYVEKFGLAVEPFTMNNPEGFYHLHGRKCRIKDAEIDFDQLGFDLATGERGRTALAHWNAVIQPFAHRVEQEGEGVWDRISHEYDQYSTREFLEANNWSEGLIETFGLLASQEAVMNMSFLELLREEVGQYYVDMVEIAGGMDRLPRAFVPLLGSRIRFGAKMFAIEHDDTGVSIHYRTAGGRFAVRGDYAVVTVPFPVLRHIEIARPLSYAKQRAIRQLHYDASAKVLLQFNRRFWEEDDGIYGGGSVTDLPIRNAYYPDHGRETGRGVVLASYTWADDAQRWGSLSEHDRVVQALENLALIHPQAQIEFECGASKMWHHDEFAGGAFAMFQPGQQTALFPHTIAPEGRLHFAGEHASLHHAWIQGAIESGLRAAQEVHEAAGRV